MLNLYRFNVISTKPCSEEIKKNVPGFKENCRRIKGDNIDTAHLLCNHDRK